jgi:hypothetical protein
MKGKMATVYYIVVDEFSGSELRERKDMARRAI